MTLIEPVHSQVVIVSACNVCFLFFCTLESVMLSGKGYIGCTYCLCACQDAIPRLFC